MIERCHGCAIVPKLRMVNGKPKCLSQKPEKGVCALRWTCGRMSKELKKELGIE
jgi:hypothetical protein